MQPDAPPLPKRRARRHTRMSPTCERPARGTRRPGVPAPSPNRKVSAMSRAVPQTRAFEPPSPQGDRLLAYCRPGFEGECAQELTALDAAAGGGILELPTAWLFGSEAHGLPPEVIAAADDAVRVPIHGRAESLNLATAAAICLYASASAHRRSATVPGPESVQPPA